MLQVPRPIQKHPKNASSPKRSHFKHIFDSFCEQHHLSQPLLVMSLKKHHPFFLSCPMLGEDELTQPNIEAFPPSLAELMVSPKWFGSQKKRWELFDGTKRLYIRTFRKWTSFSQEKGTISIQENSSEPTIDFQGIVVSFRGSIHISIPDVLGSTIPLFP